MMLLVKFDWGVMYSRKAKMPLGESQKRLGMGRRFGTRRTGQVKTRTSIQQSAVSARPGMFFIEVTA